MKTLRHIVQHLFPLLMLLVYGGSMGAQSVQARRQRISPPPVSADYWRYAEVRCTQEPTRIYSWRGVKYFVPAQIYCPATVPPRQFREHDMPHRPNALTMEYAPPIRLLLRDECAPTRSNSSLRPHRSPSIPAIRLRPTFQRDISLTVILLIHTPSNRHIGFGQPARFCPIKLPRPLLQRHLLCTEAIRQRISIGSKRFIPSLRTKQPRIVRRYPNRETPFSIGRIRTSRINKLLRNN